MYDKNTKFLVVDDFSTMRKIIKKVLGEIGYTNVIEAADGQQGLELLKQSHAENSPINIIISDWNMPRMTGIEFLRLCRETPEFKTLPFLLVTAESEQQNIVDAAKAGVSEYVVKPFSAQRIKEKLEKVFQKLSSDKKVG